MAVWAGLRGSALCAAAAVAGLAVLNNTEGVISLIFGLIKGGLMDSAKGKLAALLAKDTFRGIKRSFDSTEIGGAPLLGAATAEEVVENAAQVEVKSAESTAAEAANRLVTVKE